MLMRSLLIIAASTAALLAQSDQPRATTTTSGTMAPVIPSVVVIVNRFGVYPAEITMPTGKFVLVIRNHRGSQQETFTVLPAGSSTTSSTTSAAALGTISTKPGQAQGMVYLNLQPGTYQVAFQNETQFSVKLTVQ